MSERKKMVIGVSFISAVTGKSQTSFIRTFRQFLRFYNRHTRTIPGFSKHVLEWSGYYAYLGYIVEIIKTYYQFSKKLGFIIPANNILISHSISVVHTTSFKNGTR